MKRNFFVVSLIKAKTKTFFESNEAATLKIAHKVDEIREGPDSYVKNFSEPHSRIFSKYKYI